MNDNVILTFIGGSANLTQRVVARYQAAGYYDVAIMPDLSEYRPGFEPERVHARRERYLIRQVARDQFVALYEYLPQ